MNAKIKTKLKILSSALGMLCTAVILGISFAYAWFAQNDKVTSSNMTVKVSNPYQMFFVSVDATKADLDGSKTVNHYIIENEMLKLDSSTSYDFEGSETESESIGSSTSFLFDEILPGESITVTVNYYLADELSGCDYHIALHDFSQSGKFELDVENGENKGKYEYYVVGAFKYKPVGAKFYSDENMTTEITDKTITYSDGYKFMDTYTPFENETLPESVNFDSLTWDSSYKRASFTFVLEEDISQFYDLVDKSGVYYSNLLSERSLMISSLRIVVDNLGA